ncbi:MAG: NapC/NirT family cytochrome c [Candidatus Omnitrophica bacterium]|nr:NapC/NirT family cytochrome c [Candidatus Omnitrophota bacterium]
MMDPNNPNKKDSYFQNWISVIGGILSVIFFTVILFLSFLDIWSKEINPYIGIITYFLAPAFLTLSLILIPVGALRERAARLKHGTVRRFPAIDFNNPTHQKWAFTTIGVTTLFGLFTVFGLFRSYEFTESQTFCGRVCHEVMKPEFTAYHNSPHARVKCVECHIGPGAAWYVRSKFSGAYQVYSVVMKKYSKPIETPIKHLRPAQETCERCHWPQQFFGAVEQDKQYFLPDEANTEWRTRMLLFVGGGTRKFGKKEGIHWHMNIKNKVYYIATDEERHVIPWVKIIDPEGKERVYVDEESGFSAASPPPGEIRRMDCMDCHNRPSHNFRTPVDAVNEALSVGEIDRELPYIKREAVKALVGEYASEKEAAAGIRESLKAFYESEYPAVLKEKKDSLARSVNTVVKIYKSNFFPEMKVSWKAYPENIGHKDAPGCFRCHDNKHKTAGGEILTNDCNSCHIIMEQGKPGAIESNTGGLEFKHPDEDVGEAWKEMNCFDCHSGEIA